jgi:hypothetical protein
MRDEGRRGVDRLPFCLSHFYLTVCSPAQIKAQSSEPTTGLTQTERKEIRVEADELYLKKTTEGFPVITCDTWEILFKGVRGLLDEFLSEGRAKSPA